MKEITFEGLKEILRAKSPMFVKVEGLGGVDGKIFGEVHYEDNLQVERHKMFVRRGYYITINKDVQQISNSVAFMNKKGLKYYVFDDEAEMISHYQLEVL